AGPRARDADPRAAARRLGEELPQRRRRDELLQRQREQAHHLSRGRPRPPRRRALQEHRRARHEAAHVGHGGAMRAAVLVAAIVVLGAAAAPARADDEALVRVIAEQAQVHTGPGFGYRVVYLANRDEVLPAIGRATNDHWFRVRLPDGTYGWILGD